MKCDCGGATRVSDTRKHPEGGVWRRRVCHACGAPFTTMEIRCATNDYFRNARIDTEKIKAKVNHPKYKQPRKESAVGRAKEPKPSIVQPASVAWVRPGVYFKPEVETKVEPETVQIVETVVEMTPRQKIEAMRELRNLEKLDGYD